jgi:3-hydroxymyristoyl/3-hydroxydecanoyl-(acyl carrier protein) dehydratase
MCSPGARRFPFLLVDRVVEWEFQKRAVGYKCVTINDNFFPGHFPTRAIMPGSTADTPYPHYSTLILFPDPPALSMHSCRGNDQGGWGTQHLQFSGQDQTLHMCKSWLASLLATRSVFHGFPPPPLPGVLQIEALAQLGGIVMIDPSDANVKESFFFGGVEKCRWRKPVVPGDVLVSPANVDLSMLRACLTKRSVVPVCLSVCQNDMRRHARSASRECWPIYLPKTGQPTRLRPAIPVGWV